MRNFRVNGQKEKRGPESQKSEEFLEKAAFLSICPFPPVYLARATVQCFFPMSYYSHNHRSPYIPHYQYCL